MPEAAQENGTSGLMPEGWFSLTIFHDAELGGVLPVLKVLSELPILDVLQVETDRGLGMTFVSLFVRFPVALREVIERLSCVASVNCPEGIGYGVNLSLDGHPMAMVTVSQ